MQAWKVEFLAKQLEKLNTALLKIQRCKENDCKITHLIMQHNVSHTIEIPLHELERDEIYDKIFDVLEELIELEKDRVKSELEKEINDE